jgi:hypothetical protein
MPFTDNLKQRPTAHTLKASYLNINTYINIHKPTETSVLGQLEKISSYDFHTSVQ